VLEDGTSTGRAAEIRFDNTARVISYLSHLTPLAPRRGAAPDAAAAAAARVQALLTGSEGQIQADRVDIVLAKDGNRAERLEANGDVSVRLDTRLATGARLTYFADDGRYVMTGANAVPVKVVDGCRETSGKTLTFFKTADRIIVDGNEEIRTQTRSGGPCAAPPAAR
jgi:hypothetical protein